MRQKKKKIGSLVFTQKKHKNSLLVHIIKACESIVFITRKLLTNVTDFVKFPSYDAHDSHAGAGTNPSFD